MRFKIFTAVRIRLRSVVMLCRIDWYMETFILEEPVALILAVEYKHSTLPQIVRTQKTETGCSS